MQKQRQQRYLSLANGMVFRGLAAGANCTGCGELVFTTAMGGYLETLTDSSYCDQIVVQAFPLIGNYGVIPEDFESSKAQVAGYVVRHLSEIGSNMRSEGALEPWLEAQGIPVIAEIDTRALIRVLRKHGTMNARLSDHPLSEAEFAELQALSFPRKVDRVTRSKPEYIAYQDYVFPSWVKAVQPRSAWDKERCLDAGIHCVLVYDFGAKAGIYRELLRRGADVLLLPASTTADEVFALAKQYKAAGLMLSNGPGDPKENTDLLAELSRILRSGLPCMGICLGHQLSGLAMGLDTRRMPFGHRGSNQPVRTTEGGKVWITSQNHGYELLVPDANDSATVACRLEQVNNNDLGVEGVSYPDYPVFTVQYHPEAAAGPLDSQPLFDRFFDLMAEVAYAQKEEGDKHATQS